MSCRGLTIHSSRRRFAARLNSGVRPRWITFGGGSCFGRFTGRSPVGTGYRQFSRRLPVRRTPGMAFPTLGFQPLRAVSRFRRSRVSPVPATVASSASVNLFKRAALASGEFHGHCCLTTHSSRRRSAARLNSGVRPVSKVKSPTEKKKLSLERDRRSTYDGSSKAGRRLVPLAKARSHREERHAVNSALAQTDTTAPEATKLVASVRGKQKELRSFRKVPDESLSSHLARRNKSRLGEGGTRT